MKAIRHGNKITLLLVAVLLTGLLILLYPSISNYTNSRRSDRAIAEYTKDVVQLNRENYSALQNAAELHNRSLSSRQNAFMLTEEQQADYASLLNISEDGIMGYLEIPSINLRLPIYHGTDEEVLQTAVGHLDWSSLPIGGDSTHCVLSAHRGLPSAKLFTNLDRLPEGDKFTLRVLDKKLTYEVDKISVVEPQDTEELQIIDGEDLCTLLTCTPYGINTHRLLVRGHRIAEGAASPTLSAEANQIEPLLAAPILTALILCITLIALLFPRKSVKILNR